MSDYLHIIIIHGSKAGLGIRIAGPATPDSSYGVFVKNVTEGSLADTDGQLRAGDKLLRVGDTDLTGMTQRQAIDVLKQEAQTDSMTFTIDRRLEAYEEFTNLMSQIQNELSSASTSSMVGASPIPPAVEETEEGGKDATDTETPDTETAEKQVLVSTTQTITIPKTTSLGIVPIGLVTNYTK